MNVMDSPKVYRVGTLSYTRPKLMILFFWLLWGDFCYMLMETVVPSILPLKFTELGASNTVVGLIMMTIPMGLNFFINPMVSFKSDRYRSRWGRRIPFIITTLPFLVLFMVGVGFADKIGFYLYPMVQKLTSRFTLNQVSIAAVGLMVLFVILLSLVISKLIGLRVDRHRSGQRERLPFILAGLLILSFYWVGIGHGNKIEVYLYPYLQKVLSQLTPNQMAIAVIGLMMTLFSVFNSFVNAVFWYLFNDVIPEHLLARFMSWFRIVSLFAGAFYSFFIFPHAETHFVHIFVGGAAIYAFGFGLMCIFVREGEYPPPPAYVDGQSGLTAAFKTYGKECFSFKHYWYLYGVGICMGAAGAMGPFGLYLSQSIGLDLNQIGRLSGTLTLVGGVSILFSGWMADRYHPMRITLIGFVLSTLTAPIGFVWLFWHPSSQTVFWFCLIVSLISSPIGALTGILDPPLFMRIMPRVRYGQYCSANAMCRSLSTMIAGALGGIYLDTLASYFGKDIAYRLIPAWGLFFTALSSYFLYRLYRSWLKYGGDEAYVPPGLSETESVTGTEPGQISATA